MKGGLIVCFYTGAAMFALLWYPAWPPMMRTFVGGARMLAQSCWQQELMAQYVWSVLLSSPNEGGQLTGKKQAFASSLGDLFSVFTTIQSSSRSRKNLPTALKNALQQ